MENLRSAGFGIRLLAYILDLLIISLPLGVVVYLITGDRENFGNTWPENIIYLIYLTIVPVIWKGYIVGKRLMHIRIMRTDNKDVTFMNMVMRQVVGIYLLSIITFGFIVFISAAMIFFGKEKRGVHDYIAGTYVMHD